MVRREAAVVKAVNVRAELQEATHQCGVLEIHGEVERRPTTALFLQATRKTTLGSCCFSFKHLICYMFISLPLRANDTYLCIDVCAKLNQVFDQWDVAVDGRQVKTVVSCEEEKSREKVS